jgi:hypothetical protein
MKILEASTPTAPRDLRSEIYKVENKINNMHRVVRERMISSSCRAKRARPMFVGDN